MDCMKKIQINIDWSMVVWVSLTILFIWLLAKAVGLIHTPWYIKVIPYIAGIIAVLGIMKELGIFIQKLDGVVLDVGDIKLDIRGIRTDIHNLDKRVSIVENKVTNIESKI